MEAVAWVKFQKIDYTKYGEKPVFELQDVYANKLMTSELTLNENLYLRKHNIDTEDALF